jgi:xylose isomerase
MPSEQPVEYKFSFGPWNLSAGADPFGPPVREAFSLDEAIEVAARLGFAAIQFHDDDVVDADAPFEEMKAGCKEVRGKLRDRGLEAEFVAPRLWEHPFTVDGGPTANGPKFRKYASDRARRSVDIANFLGTKRIVWWPAREGTYLRESKDPRASVGRFVEFVDELLDYDKKIRILGEMKPNEPMDHSFCPTPGHFIGISYLTKDPDRVGVLIESAHCILAGLDPSEEMAYSLYHKKLWGVHLNDQNGLKFDQDKAFGSVNLRRAFNQVDVLERFGYGRRGEYVGLDVKPVRTQPREIAYKHLENSKNTFLALLELVRSADRAEIQGYIEARDYEGLEACVLNHLMGRTSRKKRRR